MLMEGESDQGQNGCVSWTRQSFFRSVIGSPGLKRSCTAVGASYWLPVLRQIPPQPKRTSSARLRSPAIKVHGGGSCAQPRASVTYCVAAVNAPKPMTSLPRSMIGSPRAGIHPSYSTLERYLRAFTDIAVIRGTSENAHRSALHHARLDWPLGEASR
jgi:hypothetical protein